MTRMRSGVRFPLRPLNSTHEASPEIQSGLASASARLREKSVETVAEAP